MIKNSMKCRCGQKATHFRRYEGRGYCGQCLIRQVEKNVRRTVRESGLIKPNDCIAVALSGGKDSAALLQILKNSEKDFHIKLLALSIDEGIRGQSKIAVAHARKIADKIGVDHHAFSFENEFGIRIDNLARILNRKKVNYCTYCGVLRRYLLNKKARELGATKLAVGINMDDEAQSVLMNFLRGDFSQFQRLGANPIMVEDDKFAARIKPLRNLPENETELYAVLNELPFLKQRCLMPKDTMRWQVKDFLNSLEKKRPGIKLQIIGFYDRLRPFISQKTGKKMQYCECGEPTSQENGICRACQIFDELGIRKK